VRNIDAEESVPDRVTDEQFCQALGIEQSQPPLEELAQRAALRLPKDAQRPDEIWTAVLWCLLGVLVVETLLASRVHA
jgi:hypothetical protein